MNFFELEEEGYSLFELMIVITIIGCMLLIILPSFTPISQSNEVDHFLKQLEEDLYLTQTMALSRGAPMYLDITYSRHYYRIYMGSSRILQRNYSDNMLVEGGTTETTIHFNPNGNIRNPGTLYISTNKGRYKLTFQLGKGRFDVTKL